MNPERQRYRNLWVVAIASVCACSGNISQGWQRDGGGAGGSASDGSQATVGALGERADLAPIRRLTTTQYTNTIVDIFGSGVLLPALGIQDLAVDGLVSAGTASVGVPTTDAEAFTHAAASIAAQVSGIPMRPNYSCQPSGADDTACLSQIVSTYGRKLFRRPLSDTQRAAYLSLASQQASDAGDPWVGLRAAMAAMLQSPYFLFRIDTTQGDSGNPNAWDAYTLASRMSYLVWNSTPDEALLDAADNGTLLQPEGLAAQVDRLLQDPRADAGLFEFFQETLQLSGIATAQKDPNVYTSALSAELAQQASLTIMDLLLTTNSDYRTLFTSPFVFVNADLATRYGYPTPMSAGFNKMSYAANDRSGLFGLPGITTMLSPSNRSSPTKRGEYIRQSLLCTPIPSPPATVNTTVTADPNNPRTMREIMSEHATNSECSGCHALMDPLGFALDDFDWLGNYRTSEVGLPLDLTGTVDGQSFVSAQTFGAALANDATVTHCLVQRFILYASANTTADPSTLEPQLHQAFADSGYRFKSLVRAYLVGGLTPGGF